MGLRRTTPGPGDLGLPCSRILDAKKPGIWQQRVLPVAEGPRGLLQADGS